MKELVDDYPNELNYRSTLGGMLNNLGMVLEQLDRLDDAATMYEQAIDPKVSSIEHARQVIQFREFLGKHYINYRRVLRVMGHWDKDVKAALEQLELWQDDPEQLYKIAVDMAAAPKQWGLTKPHHRPMMTRLGSNMSICHSSRWVKQSMLNWNIPSGFGMIPI